MNKTLATMNTCALAALVAIALSGCSDKKQEATAAAEGSPNLQDALSREGAKKAQLAGLPKGDPNTPMEQYVNLESGKQLMFMYYALSNMPLDYDKMASSYSDDYRRTSDGFKKQDILKAIQPRLDQEIASAKANRYFRDEQDLNIGPYDFEKKAFPLNGFDEGYYRYFYDLSDYKYGYTNSERLRMLTITDDAIARKIEEMRSKYQKIRMVVYAFAQDVDLNEKKVKCQILKFKITDRNGAEIYSGTL